MDNLLDDDRQNLNEDEIASTTSDENCFAKIMEDLEEYTTEEAEVVLSNKSKILSLLENHRAIKASDYLYGLSASLQNNSRLIVFEWNDRRKVREYLKLADKAIWRCVECYRLTRHESHRTISYLHMVNGIMLLPLEHNCRARDYELVMQYQRLLENGNRFEANQMNQKVDFTFVESSSPIGTAQPSSTSQTPSLFGSSQQPREENIFGPTRPTSTHSTIPTSSIFVFEKPSTSELKEICEKLNIEFSEDQIASRLWDEIKFEQVDTDAINIDNIETHSFITTNIFKILSGCLTGSSQKHQKIRETIFEAFGEKLVSSGEISPDELNKLSSSNTATDKLLSFMAEFIPCRILIVEENVNRMYGDWNLTNASKFVTFVLSYSNGGFSVVLNL